MAGKMKKSTKRFAQKHLKGAIQQRKATQFAKKRHNIMMSKLEDRAARADEDERRKARAAAALENMNMDDFLGGGFEGLKDGLAAMSDEEVEEDLETGSEGEEEFPSGSEDEADLEGDDDDEENDDEEEEDDEEESEEEDDGDDPVAQENRQLKGGVKSHKAQLEALKEKDPEFYKYLAETDKGLLDFSGSEDEEEEEGPEDDDEEEAGSDEEDDEEGELEAMDHDAPREMSKSRRKVLQLTSESVETWTKAALETQSLNALTNLIKAFRVAVHYGEDADRDGGAQFAIASHSAFNKLMVSMLQKADAIFRGFLDLSNKAKIPAAELKSKPRWKKVEPLLKSYLGNAVYALTQVTDANLVSFILRRLRPSASFLAPFSKVARRLLKAALNIFGSGDSQPRVQALLLIRELALVLPPPQLEQCLKGTVKAFLATAKFHTATNQGQLDFLAQSVVEIAQIDPVVTYSVAFSFVRQLAVDMHSALTSKTKEAYKEVYNWQYVHALELWARVVAHLRHSQDLRQLVYPLVQLMQGAARLVPTPRYFPLRLRMVRTMNQLAEATGVFIPTASILLEIFQFSGLRQGPKGAGAAAAGGAKGGMDFSLVLRVPKSALRTTSFQDELIAQVMELLSEHLSLHAYDVGYPELSHLPLLRLRHFVKTSPVERFRRQAKLLVQALEKNVSFVGAKRDKAEFSPKDVAQVAAFMEDERKRNASPLAQYNAALQAKARQRQAALRTDEVQLREKEAAAEERRAEEEEDGEEEMLGGADDPLHDSEDDDEEEEDADAPPRKKAKKAEAPAQKKKGGAASAAVGSSLRADIDDDMVEDLVLSESDDEDESGGRQRKPSSSGSRPQPGGRGGGQGGGRGRGGRDGGRGGGDRDRNAAGRGVGGRGGGGRGPAGGDRKRKGGPGRGGGGGGGGGRGSGGSGARPSFAKKR